MSSRAWVTLATNDSYGLGALVLANSLRRVNSAYPAVVLITPSVTEAMRERLLAVFAEVITVDVLDSRDATHLALLQRPELGITFTKIHCWSLTQYEKCVFLDADTMVVQNSDELFEREELSAAPDVGWPDCFNSGVFVFSPSADTFSRLVAFAQERGSFDGGDQGLLNSFFSDWARADINKHLPFLYNVTSAAFYSYLPALKHYGQDLKIIHFIGAAKPWLQHYNFESHTVDAPDHIRESLQLWWDIFVTQVHTQLDTTMSGVAGNLARVVPGAASYEALDELTRRQGWEAGNIDYMGADSFDKIWAKISQTLSAPRASPPKQPSPTKEPSTPVEETKVVAEVKEPISEPVQVAKPTEVSVPASPTVTPATPVVEDPVIPKAAVVDAAPVAPAAAVPASVVVPATEEPAPVPLEALPTEAAPVPVEIPVSKAPAPVCAKPSAPKTPAPTEVSIEAVPVTVETSPTAAAPVVADLSEVPVTVAAKPKPQEKTEASPETKAVEAKAPVTPNKAPATDSPPLANTPSKEEAPAVPAAKSEERRKPAGKLRLAPPAAGALPTPDSEAEDAASLASAIIAGELTPVAAPADKSPPLQAEVPPAAAVSLAQIGVKPKESIAARIESSVAAAEPPADPPKKKLVKKVVKKDKDAAGAEAPVPPPRKKEKKPKEK